MRDHSSLEEVDGRAPASTAGDCAIGVLVAFCVGMGWTESAYRGSVGQEFGSVLLAVLFPTKGSECATLVSEHEVSYRKCLTADLEGVDTDSKKQQLTFPALMAELQHYARSARGDVEIGVDQVKGVKSFAFVSGFGGQLYEMFCHRFYFAPIHQQLVEPFFSKYDTCARKTHFPELDEVHRSVQLC